MICPRCKIGKIMLRWSWEENLGRVDVCERCLKVYFHSTVHILESEIKDTELCNKIYNMWVQGELP